MTSFYPVYLNLKGKLAVIIGGGYVAEGKIPGLLQAGAHIKLISPIATPTIQQASSAGTIVWEERKYQNGDLEGAFMAIAATNDCQVNQEIFEESERSGVMLNAVDDTPRCTFIAPSIVHRGPVTLAISTGGVSPALARKLRETLTVSADLEWTDLAQVLHDARIIVKQRGLVVAPDHWQDCITSELLEMVQSGHEKQALDMFLCRLLEGTEPGNEPFTGLTKENEKLVQG